MSEARDHSKEQDTCTKFRKWGVHMDYDLYILTLCTLLPPLYVANINDCVEMRYTRFMCIFSYLFL